MKILKSVSFMMLLAMVVLALLLPGLALAQDGEPPDTDNVTTTTDNATPPNPTPTVIAEPEPEPEEPPDTLAMSTEFPKIEAIATGSFQFTVEMQYKGKEDRVFDFYVTAPAGWEAYVTPQYDSTRISSISIDASYTTTTKSVKISTSPPSWPPVEPGEYTVNFRAVSGEVVGEIDLTAKITASYSLDAVPANQVYNTKVTAGRDNIYSIIVTNMGTADIDNITFSSSKPDGWEINFTPEKIESLQIVDPKSVDVNIKPPPKAVAGDYMITLRVSGKQANADAMDIRVTVETPTIWGWVGVGIIVVVVLGLAVIFWRLGRR
jgi:uncharacterized repeat protein (TIGR01451 family)